MKVSIIIPTLNASKTIKALLTLVTNSNLEKKEVIIIDSTSEDDTVEIALKYGVKILTIPRKDFNHGSTRNLAVNNSSGEIIVFLTQDALPINTETISVLIHPLINNDQIGMSYGRQLPHPDAGYFGTFARLFNYPSQSQIKSCEDRDKLGIKTVFVSNSFAAYRRDVYEEVGGFPSHVILSEDTYIAAKILLKGYKIAYIAEAQVYHSHDYTLLQEFRRYFDIGVFYGREKWIIDKFSKAEKEGMKYLVEEMRFLKKSKKQILLPKSIARNALKYMGYKLGTHEFYIPKSIKKWLSMNPAYWSSK